MGSADSCGGEKAVMQCLILYWWHQSAGIIGLSDEREDLEEDILLMEKEQVRQQLSCTYASEA